MAGTSGPFSWKLPTPQNSSSSLHHTSTPPTSATSETEETRNILVLGEAQAGKSTLVETIRRYADAKHEIDQTLIGDGIGSHTFNVKTYAIDTDLPQYDVYEASGKPTSPPAGKKATEPNQWTTSKDVYEEALNKRKGIRLEKTKGESKRYRFNIIDTPGLNDTNSYDAQHVAKIFDSLLEATKIHLVLIVVAPGPFTPGLTHAIRSYIDMFPEFDGIISFVHTHLDYALMHPAEKLFAQNFAVRKETLQTIMGRDTFSHFVVDCYSPATKPHRNRITHSTIRNILNVALWSQPVELNMMMMNKTQRMKDTDQLIVARTTEVLRVMTTTLASKSKEEAAALDAIYEIETEINKAKLTLMEMEERLALYDREDNELLFEQRFDRQWQAVSESNEQRVEFRGSGIPIGHVKCQHDKVEILESKKDAEGTDSWFCKFKLVEQNCGDAFFHVKIYTSRRLKFHREVMEARTLFAETQKKLEELIKTRDSRAEAHHQQTKDIQVLVDRHRRHILLINQAQKDKMLPRVFAMLTQSNAYGGTPVDNMKKVSEVYELLVEAQIMDQDTPAPAPTLASDPAPAPVAGIVSSLPPPPTTAPPAAPTSQSATTSAPAAPTTPPATDAAAMAPPAPAPVATSVPEAAITSAATSVPTVTSPPVSTPAAAADPQVPEATVPSSPPPPSTDTPVPAGAEKEVPIAVAVETLSINNAPPAEVNVDGPSANAPTPSGSDAVTAALNVTPVQTVGAESTITAPSTPIPADTPAVVAADTPSAVTTPIVVVADVVVAKAANVPDASALPEASPPAVAATATAAPLPAPEAAPVDKAVAPEVTTPPTPAADTAAVVSAAAEPVKTS